MYPKQAILIVQNCKSVILFKLISLTLKTFFVEQMITCFDSLHLFIFVMKKMEMKMEIEMKIKILYQFTIKASEMFRKYLMKKSLPKKSQVSNRAHGVFCFIARESSYDDNGSMFGN